MVLRWLLNRTDLVDYNRVKIQPGKNLPISVVNYFLKLINTVIHTENTREINVL